MTLQDLTPSQEICQRLRDAGFKQETYWFVRLHKPTGKTKFYWKGDMEYDNERFSGSKPEHIRFREENEFFAAPTLQELLTGLPDDIGNFEHNFKWRLEMKKIDNMYFFEYSNHLWWRDNKAKFARGGYDTLDDGLAYGVLPICKQNAAEAAALLYLALGEKGLV
jgi:hypothetical protein